MKHFVLLWKDSRSLNPPTPLFLIRGGVLSLNLKYGQKIVNLYRYHCLFFRIIDYDILPFYVFFLKHISLICFPCESRLKNGIRPNGEGGSYPIQGVPVLWDPATQVSLHQGCGLNDYKLQISGRQLETTLRNKWAMTAALDT